MMSNPKKIVSWLIRALAVCLFLAGVVAVFTPGMLNLELVKKGIEEKISRDVGGQISYRKLKLSYFPRPHVSIQSAQISIPDSFTIDIRWMRLYPKLLPLIRGEFEIAVVNLDYADFSMKLPRIEDSSAQNKEQRPSFDENVKAFLNGVRKLPEFKLPEGNLRIKNGRINLTDPLGRIFKLRELQAAYVDNGRMMDFSVKCKSNLWEQIDIDGSIDPETFQGAGHVRLSRFRPQTLMAYLIPHPTVQIMDTRADVSLDLKSDGSGNFLADMHGTIPNLELIYSKEKLVLQEVSLKGRLKVDQKGIQAELTELKLADPGLNLTGKFVYDGMQPDIRLSVAGSHVQVSPLRQTALKLAEASETIEVLCHIIRGGTVPGITVELSGRTIADLGYLKNIVIRGRMERGEIYIPGAELDLKDVVGDVEIIEGVLNGENLSARLGDSPGQNGTLALGLNDNLEPFHLNIGIQADLSQVPPVLKRLIPDKDFQNELSRIKEVKGKADGVLILGDSLERLGARIEVSAADLTLRYDRIPYPIRVKGGRFVHAERWLSMQNFSADIGMSSITGLSTRIDWAGTPNFEAGARTAKFDLEQLHAWLSSIDNLAPRLAEIKSLAGSAIINGSSVTGPLFSPQKWNFQSTGNISQVVLTTPRLPSDLLIDRGQFTWQQSQIRFSGIAAAMGRSRATAVSGKADWNKRPTIRLQAGSAIIAPEDISPLVFKGSKIPGPLEPVLPLNGKLIFQDVAYSGPLSHAPRQHHEISAVIDRIVLNSGGLPGTLRIDRGKLALRENRFTLSDVEAYLGSSQISEFSAAVDLNQQKYFNLNAKSAKLLPAEIYPILTLFEGLKPGINTIASTGGTLTLSEIDVNGPIDAPAKWYWKLTAGVRDVEVNSQALKVPLKISRGAILVSSKRSRQAIRKIVKIETMDLQWGADHLNLRGMLDLSQREILTRITVDAESLDWDQIDAFLDYLSKPNRQPARGDDPGKMLGTITVRSTGFKWDSYTFRPLAADITFQPDKVVVTVKRADLCGISVRGLLNFSDQTLDLYFVPTTVNGKLASTLSCLTARNDLATGVYNLNGEILAKAKSEAINRSLNGRVSFSAEEGRIYRFGLLAKLLSILNVTEIYRGEIPDLTGEGFAYHGLSASGRLQGGKIIMEDCFIDGVAMGIACEGDIDFVQKKLDLLILVAPFKTVDRIVEILPLIGNVLGGKLISIPFKAKGDLNDPDVYPLPPTAVGSGILGILERTLKLPITIIQPVISGIKGSKPNPSAVPEESPR